MTPSSLPPPYPGIAIPPFPSLLSPEMIFEPTNSSMTMYDNHLLCYTVLITLISKLTYLSPTLDANSRYDNGRQSFAMLHCPYHTESQYGS